MSKILFVRKASLGDVILTTGVIREYCKINNCKVDVHTDSVDVFKNSPYVENIVRNPDKSKYEKVFDLTLVSETNSKQHSIDAYSEFVFNEIKMDSNPELFALPSDEMENLPDNFIAMHLRKHFGGKSRNLPFDFYLKVVKGILAESDLNIVIVGSSGDITASGIIDNNDGRPDSRIFDRSKLSLQQTYCVINKAKAFVGVDSSPMHIASCTKTPILSFFTQSSHKIREAKYRIGSKHISIAADIDCYGCIETDWNVPKECRRDDFECVNRFDAENVVEQLKELIKFIPQ
jgi:ADP-heptose:LPS heptosyltransferase